MVIDGMPERERVDVSLVALATRAVTNDARSRYEGAKATLGSMTGAWDVKDDEGGKKRAARGTRRADETSAYMLPRERRHAPVKATKTNDRGPSALETLRERSRTLTTDLDEALTAASEATADRRRSAEDLRASGSRRGASLAEKSALKDAEEALRHAEAAERRVKSEAERRVKLAEDKARKEQKDKEAKERASAAAATVKETKTKPADKAKTSSSKKSASSPQLTKLKNNPNAVVEVCKFVVPALFAWIIRQPRINQLKKRNKELQSKFQSSTLNKNASNIDASKLRQQVVELREERDAALREAQDSRDAAESVMQRRKQHKEVTIKKMAADHSAQLKKVREETAKEIKEAKALEVGARWRENACRRLKNQAEARASELEKKIEELERKINALENVKKAAQNVGQGVQNAAKGAVELFRRGSMRITGGNAAPAGAQESMPIENDAPSSSENNKKGRK